MKYSTLALMALAALGAGLSQTAVADDDAFDSVIVVTAQRLVETDRQPTVEVVEPEAIVDFSALDVTPPRIASPAPTLERPQIELAREEELSGQG